MKLSKTTVEILKNFAEVNQGIIVEPGNILKTINIKTSIFIMSIVPDVFPRGFAFYNLFEFLGIISIIPNNVLDFRDNYVVITDEKTNDEIIYKYSSTKVIVSPGNKAVQLPRTDKSFLLTKDNLNRIFKIAANCKLKDIKICGDKITLHNMDGTGVVAHLNIQSDITDDVAVYLKIENMQLLPVDYRVDICNSGMARFKSLSDIYNIEYYIALTAEEKTTSDSPWSERG